MTWEQAALGVVSLVAVALGAQCWRMRDPWNRAGKELLLSVGDERTLLRERAQLAERRLEEVKHALSVLWHHVRPETKEEGAAVGALRDVFSGLPIPGKPRLLDLDRAQVVLGDMLQRAEDAKRAVDFGAAQDWKHGVQVRCFTLREVMTALRLKVPEGSAPMKPEPPAHVLDALEALNAALKADPAAMGELLARRVPCSEALARHPTILVRREQEGHSASAFGLLNGCLGVIPAGPCQGEGWLALEEKSRDGELLRCVLTTRTLCAWCRSRSGDGTREHGGMLLPICHECTGPASHGKPPLGNPPAWLDDDGR